MDKIHCIGCGNEIQTEDQKKDGYSPKSVLEKKEISEIICQRCFKLKHYSIVEKSNKTEEDFVIELEKIDKYNSLFVYIVDSFDIEGSFVYRINRILQESNILLVLNKIDLFPSSTNMNKLINVINKDIKEFGIKVLDKILLSAKSDINIDVLADYISKTKYKKIYFIGCTNTGKSSILNKIFRLLFDYDRDYIVTKNMIGTTLSLIEVPYKDKLICDTPGIINNKQIFNYVSPKDISKIVAVNKIKPRNYQLREKDVLLIENLASFKYINGDINGFTFNVNNNLILHKTNETKEMDLLTSQKISQIEIENKEYVSHKFSISEAKKHNIAIAGLGFISFFGTGNIEIKTLKKVGVYLKSGNI